MDFILPNNVMDKLVCHSCRKYLSVLPIKIYPDHLIRCGRCSKYAEGTISLFNLIAERSIFRCINRFDGCKELLTPAQVSEHEKHCQYREYACPVCINPTKIRTFLFYNHFENRHSEAILNFSMFKVNVNTENKKYFLYKFEDHVFLISVVRSGAYCSGDDAVVQFTFHFFYLGNLKISNEFKIRLYLKNKKNNTQITIPVSNFSTIDAKGAVVGINKTNSEDIEYIDAFFTIESTTETIYRMPEIGTASISNLKRSSNGVLNKSVYFQKRNIYLNQQLSNSTLMPTLRDATTLSLIIKERKFDLDLRCLNCSLVVASFFSIRSDDQDLTNNVRFIKIPGDCYRLLCYECSLNKNLLSNVISRKALIPKKEFNEISFYCLWKCGKFLKASEIYQHERSCKHQPYQICPIDECERVHKQFEIVDHFVESHSLVNRPLLDLVNLLTLDTSKSPVCYYVLVSNEIMFMEFVWKEPYWLISLSCQFTVVKPRAFLYEADKKFIDIIKENGKIRHFPQIYIKCYLVHPQEMFEIEEWSSKCYNLA